MSRHLTRDEYVELVNLAIKVHFKRSLGGAYPLGRFIVDYASGAGVWIYDDLENCVFTDNIGAVKVPENRDVEETVYEILGLLRAEVVLDRLADI